MLAVNPFSSNPLHISTCAVCTVMLNNKTCTVQGECQAVGILDGPMICRLHVTGNKQDKQHPRIERFSVAPHKN